MSLRQYPHLNLGGPLMSRPGGSCVFPFTVVFWSALSFSKDEIFIFFLIIFWTMKTAERRRIDTFELWCWRRLLGVPWTARRSNQSILKEISPGVSLEGMMLKLKLQYFGPLMRRVDSLEKTLMLGGIGGRRRRGRQRHH